MAQLTVDLPQPIFQRLKKHAKTANRDVGAELIEVLRKALSIGSDAPREVESVVDGLQFLTDTELRKVAHPARIRKTASELAKLNDKCQREGLSDAEKIGSDQLLNAIERFVLIRAEALCLLRQRGRDVSGLLRA